MNELIVSVRKSLEAISAPRWFETERGFQGELLVQLRNYVELSEAMLIEQEYQKKLKVHGLKIRPDIIIHQPFNSSIPTNRKEGNLAVFELKLNASEAEALADFHNLERMLEVLKYETSFFINIGSIHTFSNLVPAALRGRITCFAISLVEGKVVIIEEGT